MPFVLVPEILPRLRDDADIELTEASVILRSDDDASELGAALLQTNSTITQLDLGLEPGLTEEGDYGSLLEFLRHNENLSFVCLISGERDSLCSAVLARFLRALSRGGRPRQELCLANTIVTFDSLLSTFGSFRNLVLARVAFESLDRDDSAAAAAISEAWNRRGNFRLLRLCSCSAELNGAFFEALEKVPATNDLFLDIELETQFDCQALLRSLPQMKMHRLKAILPDSVPRVKEDFVQALRQNGSVQMLHYIDPSLTAAENALIKGFCQRNLWISTSVASRPTAVQNHLLSNTCAAALQCTKGPEWVYRLLLSKGDEVRQCSKRGRKRPRRFEPS
jgi:hypothetical protein